MDNYEFGSKTPCRLCLFQSAGATPLLGEQQLSVCLLLLSLNIIQSITKSTIISLWFPAHQGLCVTVRAAPVVHSTMLQPGVG